MKIEADILDNYKTKVLQEQNEQYLKRIQELEKEHKKAILDAGKRSVDNWLDGEKKKFTTCSDIYMVQKKKKKKKKKKF